MNLPVNLTLALALWLGGYAAYLLMNRGLAPNARLQQLLRYLPAAVVAVVPIAVSNTGIAQPALLLALVVSVAWMVSYPLAFHLTNRRSSPDYDHRIDVAKWTRQELGKAQYDETLIDFLDEADPKKKNLVVLHLKGSHFNYENRFKESSRQWGAPGSHDQITNYKNTLYYTDGVLKQAFDYCCRRLNLQAMVYFSDHADVPDRHRQPNFGGYRDICIPLMVWLSPQYRARHSERAAALRQNRNRYWTNDLAYELMCGVFDVRSNHFREENSLASARYRYQRGELTAMNGRVSIAADEYEPKAESL